jgi:hypothetical protein
MTEQLPLFRVRPDDPNVEWLKDLLLAKGGWMTAAQICEVVGDRIDDRRIRALAEAAGGWVISGQRGYLHIKHAKAGEIDHCVAAWESQASRMQDRARRTRILAHSLVG